MAKQFTYSKAPLRRVTEIQFCVWSPDAITAQSVTQEFTTSKGESVPAGVSKPVTFVDGEGIYGGVNDPRMGGDNDREDPDDPGFFGHINLAEPMYNVGFINEVRTILGCVCFHCGTILEDARNVKMRDALKLKHPKARRRAIHACTKIKRRCFGGDELGDTVAELSLSGGSGEGSQRNAPSRTIGCGRPQPIKIMKPSADKLYIEFDGQVDDIPGNGEKRQQLLAKDAHAILKMITDDDIIKLGYHPKYARPEWFVWTVLPVPPPPTRPSVEFGSGMSDDDLTHKYINIVKANNALKRSKENGDAPNIQQEVCFLFYCFFLFFSSSFGRRLHRLHRLHRCRQQAAAAAAAAAEHHHHHHYHHHHHPVDGSTTAALSSHCCRINRPRQEIEGRKKEKKLAACCKDETNVPNNDLSCTVERERERERENFFFFLFLFLSMVPLDSMKKKH